MIVMIVESIAYWRSMFFCFSNIWWHDLFTDFMEAAETFPAWPSCFLYLSLFSFRLHSLPYENVTNKHGLHVIILLHGNTGLVIYNHLYTQPVFFLSTSFALWPRFDLRELTYFSEVYFLFYNPMVIFITNIFHICPTRCNVTQFILSGNCSICFGWHHHPSSGTQITVSTASGICHTVTAICRYRGRVGTGLSVLTTAQFQFQLFHDSGR